VPGILMLLALAEVVIDMVQLGFAIRRMPSGREWPIIVVRISVAAKRPFRVGDPDVENASLLENPHGLGQKVRDFLQEFEMLEGMFAVDMSHAAIGKGPALAQI